VGSADLHRAHTRAARHLPAASGSALFFAYVGLDSVGRLVIEGLRPDSSWLGAIRVPQAASALCFISAIIGLIRVYRHTPLV